MNIQDFTWQTFKDGDKVMAIPDANLQTRVMHTYETLNLPAGRTIDGKDLDLVWQYQSVNKEWFDCPGNETITASHNNRQVIRLKTQTVEDKKENMKTAEEIFMDYNSNGEPWLHEDDVIGAMEEYADQFKINTSTIVQKTLEYVVNQPTMLFYPAHKQRILAMREDILKEIRK